VISPDIPLQWVEFDDSIVCIRGRLDLRIGYCARGCSLIQRMRPRTLHCAINAARS